MNYIGSKYSILNYIDEVIEDFVKPKKNIVFCDIFAAFCRSDKDFLRHFAADGDPGLLDVYDHVSAQLRDYRHHAAHHKAQILQVLFDLRLAADPLDDRRIAFAYQRQRHHAPYTPFNSRQEELVITNRQ